MSERTRTWVLYAALPAAALVVIGLFGPVGYEWLTATEPLDCRAIDAQWSKSNIDDLFRCWESHP